MSTSNHDDVGVKAETTTPVFQNPYEGHRSLSASEQQVLGEYARLAATLRRVANLSTQLSSSALHTDVLNELRAIERKMGLVLTLFKASVWAIVMQQTDGEEDAEDMGQEADVMPYDTIAEEPEEDEVDVEPAARAARVSRWQ
ncbi:dash complex subunit dad3 [Malassezia pachydermatis]|uniref:DASH complex subunit DAD3 n=1 Tax=Malassezia pachydermatis TaxID=77020 RepID=A0A0M8MNA0_9BASI|nr:dash complex subunit dad3 [Malassezia pachydermatis]KOS15008.1 dash complex subunit dad3 [Malassezia pachydermatis]